MRDSALLVAAGPKAASNGRSGPVTADAEIHAMLGQAFLGQLSLLCEQPRESTVRALTSSALLEFDGLTFKQVVDSFAGLQSRVAEHTNR